MKRSCRSMIMRRRNSREDQSMHGELDDDDDE
jgi:hypothetical protein